MIAAMNAERMLREQRRKIGFDPFAIMNSGMPAGRVRFDLFRTECALATFSELPAETGMPKSPLH